MFTPFSLSDDEHKIVESGKNWNPETQLWEYNESATAILARRWSSLATMRVDEGEKTNCEKWHVYIELESGTLEINNLPAHYYGIKGQAKRVIMALYQRHISTNELCRDVFGDTYVNQGSLRSAISRTNKIIEQFGWLIESVSGNYELFSK